MREFVKETDIYKRERLVNLKIFPYVASKIWVAVLLALFHALAYTVLQSIAFKMPISGFEYLLLYVTLFLAVLSGMISGLLASALSPAASSAPMIMIMFIIPQIVLSGVLSPVPIQYQPDRFHPLGAGRRGGDHRGWIGCGCRPLLETRP